MAPATSVLWGLALSGLGAAIVAATKQGTRAGALAGLVSAVAASLGFGAPALLPLAVFVLGSGFLTRLGRATKEALGAAEANDGRRGVANVVAKLGLPGIVAIAAAVRPESVPGLATAYASGLAAVFADTASSEIGPLSRGAAFRVGLSGIRRVPHGTAGAMSVAGVAAAIAAALMIGAASAAVGLVTIRGGLLATFCGVVASVAESVLATTRMGQRVGHHGRNAALSATAIAISLAAAH
jgi:uncharacterized protein (TIGR00297 family)